ncbi:MAG: ArsI/CadI family heavy metal resistance metalloenzyme [Candidatus Kapaibacterium sp.]
MEATILFPHISINVKNIDRSVAFYKAFFNAEPVKIRPGYAKFELANPKLNFALNEKFEGEIPSAHTLNHFGFQVESTDDVLLTDLRLRNLGIRTVEEQNTTCCYAIQDKIWVQDPDGVNWEVFVVKSDADVYRETHSSENGPCCTSSKVQITAAIAS